MRRSIRAPALRVSALFAVSIVAAVLGGVSTVRAGAPCEPSFIRGDANADGRLDISDPLSTLDHLFLGVVRLSCLDAADANDDDELDLADAVFELSFLFLGGTPIPPPIDECGQDPTPSDLGCAAFPSCPMAIEPEVCDGIDNDCNGIVDDGFDLHSVENCGECGNDCAANDWENVAAYDCVAGRCVIAACEDGFYDLDGIDSNGCESVRPPDGTPCDDRNPCTENDRFFLGVCGGTPKDCSGLADPCNRSDCDPATGECYRIPRPSRPCDDGDPRTIDDRCDETGECVGTAI